VITKVPDGSGGFTRLIVGSARFPLLGGRHDPWCAHGNFQGFGPTSGGDLAEPGQSTVGCSFILKDGIRWTYLYGGAQDCRGGFDTAEETAGFVVPGLHGFYFGEGFNYVLRRMPTLKFKEDGWLPYVEAMGADWTHCAPV
jgi:hypothetical protein